MRCQLNLLLIITALCIPFAHLRNSKNKRGARNERYYLDESKRRYCKCSSCPNEFPEYIPSCDYPFACAGSDLDCVDEDKFILNKRVKDTTESRSAKSVTTTLASYSSISSTKITSSPVNKNVTQDFAPVEKLVPESNSRKPHASQIGPYTYTTATMRGVGNNNTEGKPPEGPTATLIGVCVAILVSTFVVCTIVCIVFARKYTNGHQRNNLTGALSKVIGLCDTSTTELGSTDGSEGNLMGKVDEDGNPNPNGSPIPPEENVESPYSSGYPAMPYLNNVQMDSRQSESLSRSFDNTSAGCRNHNADCSNVSSPSSRNGCNGIHIIGDNNNAAVQATGNSFVHIGTLNFYHTGRQEDSAPDMQQANSANVSREEMIRQRSVAEIRQEPSGQERSNVRSNPTFLTPARGVDQCCVTNVASLLPSDKTEPMKSDAHSSVDNNSENVNHEFCLHQPSSRYHRPSQGEPSNLSQLQHTIRVPVQHSSQAETEYQISGQNSSFSIAYPPVADSEKPL